MAGERLAGFLASSAGYIVCVAMTNQPFAPFAFFAAFLLAIISRNGTRSLASSVARSACTVTVSSCVSLSPRPRPGKCLIVARRPASE